MVTNRFFVSLAACVLVLATGLGAQELPPLFGPDGSPPDTDTIQARVAHWVSEIKTSPDAAKVVDARKKLITECGRLEDSSLRSQYASTASPGLLSVLTDAPADDDALVALRELNATIAAARMNQVGVNEVLATAVKHANPGVRLWGWRGYAGILDRVLAQGGSTSGNMFSSLEAACTSEPSPLVRGAMFDLINLPAVRPDLASDEMWSQTADRFRALLLGQWPTLCNQILAGDLESLQTAGQAIRALESLSSITSGPQASTQVVQALADMLWATYGAYNDASDGDVAIAVAGGAMLTCEGTLRRVSTVNEELLKLPLTATKLPGVPGSIRDHATRASFVGGAVVKWVESLVEDHAIIKPDVHLKPAEEEGDAATDSGE